MKPKMKRNGDGEVVTLLVRIVLLSLDIGVVADNNGDGPGGGWWQ